MERALGGSDYILTDSLQVLSEENVIHQSRLYHYPLGYVTLMQDAIKQSKVYRLIGEILLKQGKLREGQEILRQALAVAELVNHEPERAAIVCEIALALARTGEFDQAMMALETITLLTKDQIEAQRDEILTAIQVAKVAEIKAMALSEMAQVMAKK